MDKAQHNDNVLLAFMSSKKTVSVKLIIIYSYYKAYKNSKNYQP